MAKKVRDTPTKSKKKKSSNAPAGKKTSNRSKKTVRLIASEALSSLNAIGLQLQSIALHGDKPEMLGDDIANNMTKHITVHGVISALIEKRANPTFLAKGWSGSLTTDYRFTEQDFPSFLSQIALALSPLYHFAPSSEFKSKELKDTLGGLAASVSRVTTP